MLKSVIKEKLGEEGYVYKSYGHPKYLKHVVASVNTLRRYDEKRPVALICTEKHRSLLEKYNLTYMFDVIYDLPKEHTSIVGFKHNLYNYLFFDRTLFLDSDIIWCKNPDALWKSFQPYDFTITGNMIADNFFGAPKSGRVVIDVILRRRQRTLKKFGLSYLSRAQTGMMYASDFTQTKKVCELAKDMLKQINETHFQSRIKEKGRTEESCEWSLAMAMAKLDIPVYPWLQGHNSPQLDYIEMLTEHDEDFEYVKCKYFSHRFVYSLRGLKRGWKKKLLMWFFSLYPSFGDYMMVTPFCLHFGWYHEKQPFLDFSERIWDSLTPSSYQTKIVNTQSASNVENKSSRN